MPLLSSEVPRDRRQVTFEVARRTPLPFVGHDSTPDPPDSPSRCRVRSQASGVGPVLG